MLIGTPDCQSYMALINKKNGKTNYYLINAVGLVDKNL